MKKFLTLMLALVMSLTSLFAIPITAQAAQGYNSSVINANVDYVKNYIKSNGFINGNGKYTLQHSETYKSLRYYGLFMVDPNNNSLTLKHLICDIDTDELLSATSLEIPYASTEIMETDVNYWVYSTNYSDINGYAYIDKNFNHNTQTPVFYINSNSTDYSEYEAKDMCETSFYLAFSEWEFMMEDIFGMNLSVLGFHSYCTGHTYGYNGDSCVFCGAYKPVVVSPTQPITPIQPSPQPALSITPTTEIAPAGAEKVNGEWVAKKQKKAAIKKLTKGKKSIKITWKKVSGVSGYQIQCATDKKFKKNKKTVTVKKNKTTSATIKKLKAKKTYYVRIRTYKIVKVNGKSTKVYSSWSKAKTVKTK